jgi:2'-5' RNA ligase
MPYTIAIFPEFKCLNEIRSIIKKYNPNTNELKPHIALVYYFKKKPGDEIISKSSSFEIRLNKISESSRGNYIFLHVTDGKGEIVKLKNMLYKKLGLKWGGDFSYNPHITLGKFKTKAEQKKAMKEIGDMNLDFSCKINSFLLLEMNDDLLTLKSKKKFRLS